MARYRSRSHQMARQAHREYSRQINEMRATEVPSEPSIIDDIAAALEHWFNHDMSPFVRKVLGISRSGNTFYIRTRQGLHEHNNHGTIYLYGSSIEFGSNIDGVSGVLEYGDPQLFDQLKLVVMRIYNGESGEKFR